MEAACRGMDTNMFFPAGHRNVRGVAQAKLVCAECPVREQCLEFAKTSLSGWERQGVWGGVAIGYEFRKKKLRTY
ncbi:MAG TPA: WhiB family transcriptional regulator [Acidimicrobiales bacterium]|nr:WhiB family transcriptional regulator [Acidimicrobiales bacterium]